MMGYLEKLEFSKDWTKAEDFPTYEPDESQVRADLQLLHNEAKAAINALVDKLESAEFASHLAVSAEGMTATNLRRRWRRFWRRRRPRRPVRSWTER